MNSLILKSRMYDLLQKKYGKVTSMSDLDIEFQNARHDLAEREKSRKMGELSNKIHDEKTRTDSDDEEWSVKNWYSEKQDKAFDVQTGS